MKQTIFNINNTSHLISTALVSILFSLAASTFMSESSYFKSESSFEFSILFSEPKE